MIKIVRTRRAKSKKKTTAVIKGKFITPIPKRPIRTKMRNIMKIALILINDST